MSAVGQFGAPGQHNQVELDFGQVGEYEEFQSPPSAPQESSYRIWGKWAVCALGAGGAIALRFADYSRWTNAIGSFGAGFFAQAGIQASQEGETLARIRQCSLTAFGQVALFAFTQTFANVKTPFVQVFFTHAIIAQFGVNVAIAAFWLYQQGAIRIECENTTRRPTLNQTQCINHNVSHGVKVIAACGAGVGYFLLSDPILKGLASFLGSFFLSQVAGERVIDHISEKIKAHPPAQSLASNKVGTRYRYAQTILTTLGYLAQPLIFTPWIKPNVAERIRQLIYVGITLGFFNGILDRSQKRRIKGHPIEDLEEFHKLSKPEKPDHLGCEAPTFKYVAHRVWKYAVPLISICGLIGFTLWQQIAPGQLNSVDSRIALGAMLGGFLATYPLARWVDSKWDAGSRHFFLDKAMTTLWFSPRILGMHPLFIFYMGTNAMQLDSSALDQLQSPYHVATAVAAYTAYGIAMARELAITSSERLGNAQLKYPGMLMIDATLTTVNSIKGIIP